VVKSLISPVKSIARRVGVRRSGVAALRMRTERNVLALMSKPRPATSGRILCYHSVGTPQWGVNDVTPEQFRDHIESAVQLGYRFVPAATIAQGAGESNDLAITFDDGLLSICDAAAPILSEYGIPWSVFVVTGWADGIHAFGQGIVMGWREIESLAARGVEIGSHSKTHPDFGSLPLDEARAELVESRQAIEKLIGVAPSAFAIPLGHSKNWSSAAFGAAVDAGYERIYAQSVINRPRSTVARTFITTCDDSRLFKAALDGAFDAWEEWV
jgi:peptidoglycan/xylan/chitin deacetylase (PgdA/CDA1 family)